MAGAMNTFFSTVGKATLGPVLGVGGGGGGGGGGTVDTLSDVTDHNYSDFAAARLDLV